MVSVITCCHVDKANYFQIILTRTMVSCIRLYGITYHTELITHFPLIVCKISFGVFIMRHSVIDTVMSSKICPGRILIQPYSKVGKFYI